MELTDVEELKMVGRGPLLAGTSRRGATYIDWRTIITIANIHRFPCFPAAFRQGIKGRGPDPRTKGTS
jgi:hypothetical protein